MTSVSQSATEPKPEADSAGPKTRRAAWLDIIAIFALTVLVYLPCLRNGFVNFDDRAYIINNPLVQTLSWSHLAQIWTNLQSHPYYPIVFSTYALLHELWGANPADFHAFSVLLHALNAVLAYVMVTKLFQKRTPALITGLLVGLHPLHVDAVAWASDLKDVMSGTFLLLTVIAYLGYLRKSSRAYYGLSLALYTLALLARTMAALLPFLLLIVDYQQRRKDRRLELLEKVPFLVVAAVLGYITLRGQSTGFPEAEALTYYSRTNAWAALGFYLMKLAAPLKLTVLYPSTAPAAWLTLAIFLSIAFVAMTVWMLMLSRDYGFGLAWFVLMAAPILGFVPFGYVTHVAPYANHFMYIADVGLFVCAGLLAHHAGRALNTRRAKAAFCGVIGVAFLLFCTKTALRCGIWQSSETLWRDSVRYNTSPNATIGHFNLARTLVEKGDRKDALADARQAVLVDPRNQAARHLEAELAGPSRQPSIPPVLGSGHHP